MAKPGELFYIAAGIDRSPASWAAVDMYLWRSGRSTPMEFAKWLATLRADPGEVRCAFLSIAGDGESPVLIRQAEQWHQALPVAQERLVRLDAASGADAHCQVNNPTRLAQEACDRLDDFFAGRAQHPGSTP